MNTLVIVLIAAVCLFAGYTLYGRWLANKWGIDPKAKTPAVALSLIHIQMCIRDRGCTATIIYQMYQEAGVKVEPKIAGLLCSAIVSDTLLFRSPTCTAVDEMAARALADIAGIDIEKYAMEMFSAGSNLKDKSDEEIFYQDFKRFTSGKVTIGVGPVSYTHLFCIGQMKGFLSWVI